MLIRNLLRAGTPLSKINDPNTPLYRRWRGFGMRRRVTLARA